MTKHSRFTRHSLALAVSGAISLGSATALAQEKWAIEEVTVTAQKREQSLQDVPLSVSAFSGNMIRDAKVTDAKELSVLTPGVTGDSDDSFLDSINIRGIVTNDFGVGAEPSVGMYQDGVYLGRTGGAVTSFFDISGVEVVKGPQGTLFGRNSSAGAISIKTNRPDTQALSGSIDVGLGEDNYNTFTGVINVPLSDQWAMRAAIYHEEVDGWIKNLAGGDDYGWNNNDAARVSFGYEGDKLSAVLALEYEDREANGSIYNVTNLPNEPQVTGWDQPTSKYGVVNSDLGSASKDEGEVWGATLTLEYDLNSDYSLTSITAIRGHNYAYLEDFDGSPFAIDHYGQDQEQKYYSQEIRLNYNGDGPVTWFAGASFYKEKLKAKVTDSYDEDQQCGFATAAYYASEYGGTYDPADYNCASYYYFAYAANYGASGPLDNGPGAGYITESRYVDAEYDGWGIYGDATWHATDSIDLTFGLRYTEDSRDFGLWVTEDEGNYPSVFNGAAYTDTYVYTDNTWENLSPRIALNWTVSEELSAFVNISRGYKAGGYNSSDLEYLNGTSGYDFLFDAIVNAVDGDGSVSANATGLVDIPAFDEETVLNYEMGIKSNFWDRRVQLNASIYQYEFEDYQVNFFNSDTNTVNVANAGDAEGRGLEADIRILPTPNLDIYLGVSLMDTELVKVKSEAICDTDCKGNQLPGTVETSYALVATYTLPVDKGDWRFTLENFYQDDFSVDFDDRKDLRGDDYNKVNARVGFESHTGWSASVYVENLTDEEYYIGAAYSDFTIGAHRIGPQRGRFVGAEMSYNF